MSEELKQAAQQALEALRYHVEQTRPIQKTSDAIAHLERALTQRPAAQAGEVPCVTLGSAIEAIEHVSAHNGPGREAEAIAKLRHIPQPAAQATPDVPETGFGKTATPEPLHLFEFWWESHMPQATQSQAWAAWTAAQNSKGATIEAPQQAAPEPGLLKTFLSEADRAGVTHLPATFATDLAAAAAPEPLTGCNCRWKGDTQVEWCEHHRAHLDAIHEWAQRAKSAEAKLKATPEQVVFSHAGHFYNLVAHALMDVKRPEACAHRLHLILDELAALMGQPATPEPVGEALQFPPMPEGWPARFRCDSCDGNGEIGELVSMGHFQPPERQTCPDCGGRGWASEEHAFNADHMREFAEAHALLTRPAPGVPDVEDLRDRLVAISAAVADCDDRAAQSMLGEILRMLAAAQAKGAKHG